MNGLYSVADQAAACLKRIDFEHQGFENCDTASLKSVASCVRKNITLIDLPAGDGMSLRYGRYEETPTQLIERCIGNTWRVVGHEYQLDTLDYNISPDPSENSRGSQFGEWTWQLNRHEEWLVTALQQHQRNDPSNIEALSKWIRTWIETCPAPTQEFNTELTSWRTIEIGIRLGRVWPHVFHVVKDAEDFDDELLLAWLNSVAEQCDFVWAHRKTRNWLMMEMNGLLTVSIMFPFFKEASEWYENALRIHIEEIDNQFLLDGMQVELSAGYHGVSFRQYIRCYKILKGDGRDIPIELTAAMRKMLHPWRAMVRPDGWVFGFQDSGSLDYTSWLNELPDEIKTPEDSFFSLSGAAPKHLNNLLPYAGQGVLRSGWTMNDTAVAIDVGPFGAAHQHEDKLSIQIWSRGKDLLGEAGKVDYADSPQRRYSLGTLAHSTAIVDGHQQNSRRQYKGQDGSEALVGVTSDLESSSPWIKGIYDCGYGHEGDIAVRHERSVMLNSANLITVTDQFYANDDTPHTIEILFHLLKEEYEMQEDGARSIGEGPNLILTTQSIGDTPLIVEGICGKTEPDLRGWAEMDPVDYKGSYDLVPRPCITIKSRMSGSIKIVTQIHVVD